MQSTQALPKCLVLHRSESESDSFEWLEVTE